MEIKSLKEFKRSDDIVKPITANENRITANENRITPKRSV